MNSSSAARVKFKCLAAASKPRSKSSEGIGWAGSVIPLAHASHSEMSFYRGAQDGDNRKLE